MFRLFLKSFLKLWFRGKNRSFRHDRSAVKHPRWFSPWLEQLEGRLTPSSVSVLGTSASTSGFGFPSFTLNYQMGAGTNRLLVVSIGDTGTPVTGVTFGGAPLTQAIHEAHAFRTATDIYATDIWYLPLGSSAAANTGNVVVSYEFVNTQTFIVATSFSNANQTTPLTSTSNDDPSLAVSSVSGDMVLDAMSTGLIINNGSDAPGGGQTLQAGQQQVAPGLYGGVSTAAGAASVTMTWPQVPFAAHVAVDIHQAVLVAPTVITPTDTSITATTATLGGNVTNDGSTSATAAPITARGVVYAKTKDNSNPRIGGTGVTEVDDAVQTTGVFTENVTGLTAGTGYSFVAFATNSVGTTYTSPVSTFGTPAFYDVTTTADGAGTLTTAGHAGSQADPYQDTTLRGAIAAATANGGPDTIGFDSSLFAGGPATITLTQFSNNTSNPSEDFGPSALRISSPITIQGPTGDNGLTIQRSTANTNQFRLFYVYNSTTPSSASLTLQNLTLAGGLAQGFSGSGGAAGMGGAIFNRQGTVSLQNSTLSGNTAQGGAGGLGTGPLSRGGSYFGGGGVGSAGISDAFNVYGAGGGPNGGVNAAGGFGGGGAENQYGGFNGGFAGGGGDGYFNGGGNGGFGGGGGGAGGGGGGASAPGYSGFSGGTGGFGGGNGTTAGTRDGAGGGGAGMGGAVFNYQGSVTITNSTVAGNSARGGSGADSIAGKGSGLGGGVFNYNGTLTVLDATLASNTVAAGSSGNGGSAAGGAIYSIGDGNSPNGNVAATVTLNNTILANTTGGTDFFRNAINGGTATASSGVGNVIMSNGAGSNGFSGTIVSSANPLLAALANNGGPTETMALLPGSPAIGAGISGPGIPTTDQRGLPRHSLPDLGAFEFQTGVAVTTASANVSASVTTLFITGIGFGGQIAADTVTLSGGASAVVTKASATKLTVSVTGLTAGPLAAVVSVNGVAGASTQVATVIPVLTPSAVSLQGNASSLVINGFGFDPTPANNVVTFGGAVTGIVSSATANQLTVTNLSGLTLGSVTASVAVNGLSSGPAVQVATVAASQVLVTANTNPLAYNATTLTIQGSGFSATAKANVVTFSGGATGKVTSATPTQLTVTSLTGLPTGNLSASVTVGGTSSAFVQVATVAPVATASTATLAANAASLTIHGFAFSTIPANNTVTFSGGATGIVTAATATTLTVTSLTGLSAGSLTATVTSNSVTSASVQVATVIPVATKSTAGLGVNATSLIINGFGFDPTTAHDTVSFSGGATGTVSSATATQLTVTNLGGLKLGSLTAAVTVDGQSSGAAMQVATVTPVVTINGAYLPANPPTPPTFRHRWKRTTQPIRPTGGPSSPPCRPGWGAAGRGRRWRAPTAASTSSAVSTPVCGTKCTRTTRPRTPGPRNPTCPPAAMHWGRRWEATAASTPSAGLTPTSMC